MDDSPFAPLFSLAMVLWAVLFIKFWQRREASLSLAWGTIWHDQNSDRRPEFSGANWHMFPRWPCE